jgi:hypothetical protein
VPEQSNTKPLSELEAALSKLLAEKSRRDAEKTSKGELIVRRVICREGEQIKPQKGVSLIRRVIVSPPPVDPDKVWHGQHVDPVEVAKRETAEQEPDQMGPRSYVWITVRNAHPEEGGDAGEIREGHYGQHDGKIIVTDNAGSRIGAAEDTGNPAAVARDILRKAYDKERPLRGFDIGAIV